jgi:hypothetical protein
VSHAQIIKSDFAHKIGVHMRDLRVVFQKPSSSERAEGAIYVNESVVLFSIEGLQIVFTKDEPLIFNYKDSAIAAAYTSRLKEHLYSMRDSITEVDQVDRYCLEAFDIALATVCDNIYSCLNDLAQDPLLVHALVSNLDDFGAKDIMKLSKLLPIKEKLRILRKRCAVVNHALEHFCHDETMLKSCIMCPRNMKKKNQSALFGLYGDDMMAEDIATNDSHDEEEDEMELIFLEDLIMQFFLDIERASTQAESLLECIANQEGWCYSLTTSLALSSVPCFFSEIVITIGYCPKQTNAIQYVRYNWRYGGSYCGSVNR